ncbi:unnamed protein product [Ceutorhynchus assimilis]|uniref:Uncharacterized protein n=1 Tax=Ceutorhynchus assimilis TaxID=467358 RepID=A0A9N9QST6_9CUCU|nr:unnamed protein product [Ceutorhynchus assimilis]
MGFTLQVILGILFLTQSFGYNLREIREAPPPTPPPQPIQNATEINNRDLNKIVKVNPKTEALDSKTVYNFEDFPIKLAEKNETKEGGVHQIDKFWSTDFHNKNYVFTFSPSSRHPSFDNNADLTTPTTKLFDQKFKENVESVEQKLDEVELENDEQDIEEDDLNVDDLINNKNSSLEFEKTKTIVNNETIEKNSIHKDLSIEQTKKVNFENLYNDTKIYDSNVITSTSTTMVTPTRKSSLMKETVSENVLSNNIETDFINPIKSTTMIIPLKLGTNVTQKTTTIMPETTTFLNSMMQSDATTTTIIPETTTTTEIIDTTIFEEIGLRTSKSLDKNVATSETTTSSIRNELDSTTLNNGKLASKIKEIVETTTMQDLTTTIQDLTTTMQDLTTTTTMQELTTTTEEVEIVTTTELPVTEAVTIITTTDKPVIITTTTDKPITTTTTDKPVTITTTDEPVITTEFAFVHIKSTDNNHTTLQPEILSSNLNYSTSKKPDEIRKVVVDDVTTSSSTTVSTTSTVAANITTPTILEEVSETGTESYTKDGAENHSGSNKGVIAAIAISSVGAVCLVLLAGLLYVMKKRQKRLNYGPRCRPVSLDDYSIDNLSVYNSVRRKGGARMSKRSFGNPAFEDPVAPTHPLNFQALSRFATNLEDIKAEFEEVPQITARTSELPEGCDTKNRYANVIPLPETRVYLNPIDGYPNSDYINANYVTGPKDSRGYYIATQGPMQNTVDDFWRMIWEQQCKVVLMLTHLVENGLEKCADYLPESEVLECSRMFGDFQITLKKREVKEKYIISSLQLKNMVSNSWREITHFWYLGWPEKGVPSEVNSLIAFLIEARSYMKTATIDKRDTMNGIHNNLEHNPVVVHCSPGTGRTGVAIACDIAIREFETTRLVDIPKIVYRIRRDRANAIQTKEQYMFIYKVVSLYATKLTGGGLEGV